MLFHIGDTRHFLDHSDVAPLVVATGAGAEIRQSLGTAVFGGMPGVTGFGLIFTPAFYTLVQRVGAGRSRASANLRDSRNQGHEGPGAVTVPIGPQAGH